MTSILKTNISKAYWYSHDSTDDLPFKPAIVSSLHTTDNNPEEISWVDKLFEGGIFIPDEPSGSKQRALSMLITGPPGSGKSTLAMELCYRLTKSESIDGEGINSLYVTSESDESWLIEKAKSFKWPDAERIFVPWDDGGEPRVPLVTVWQTQNFKEYLNVSENQDTSIFRKLLSNTGEASKIGKELPEKILKELEDLQLKGKIADKNPQLLVVDSLNTIESSAKSDTFDKFMELTTCGPKIIVLIIDTLQQDSSGQHWEFLADNVIRLDRVNKAGYMVRTIEIVKARYQSHIWGQHQLKIYSPFDLGDQGSEGLRRGHPYREEGGIFLFPSIHYYLSSYKRKTPKTEPISDRTKLPSLNEVLHGGYYMMDKPAHRELKRRIKNKDVLNQLKGLIGTEKKEKEEFISQLKTAIGEEAADEHQPRILKHAATGGFPSGRCTGFIGCRGGHKSHLGYLQLLSRVINHENEKGLIISLRDDEGMARKTMSKIIHQEFVSTGVSLSDLEQKGKLEIIYYPPGYITPEEFFHRMYLSIQSMKHSRINEDQDVKISLLFNSLDQLSSRFPLCAKEEIFVPGIIETLSAEDITSFFIAVEEPGQPEEQYGLLSMADVIIKFSHKLFARKHYCGHLNEYLESESRKLSEVEIERIKIGLGEFHPAIVMRVIRFAGGQAAGAGGILDLIDNRSPVYDIYALHDDIKSEGLYFTPFSPKHDQGIDVND